MDLQNTQNLPSQPQMEKQEVPTEPKPQAGPSNEEVKKPAESIEDQPESEHIPNEKEEGIKKKYSTLKRKYKSLRTEYLSILELLDSTNCEMKSLANERNFLKSKLESFLNSQNFNDGEERSPSRIAENAKHNN